MKYYKDGSWYTAEHLVEDFLSQNCFYFEKNDTFCGLLTQDVAKIVLMSYLESGIRENSSNAKIVYLLDKFIVEYLPKFHKGE